MGTRPKNEQILRYRD